MPCSATADSAEIELEQVDGIAPADLQAIVLADAGAVEPVGGVIDVFERPVDREQNAVRSDLENGIDQRLGAEIARSGQEEVGVEVVADLLFRLVLRRRLDPAVAMIDAPHAVGQAFAHVAQDDLEFRMGIEQARSHQAQRMNRRLLSERPGRAHQPRMSFIDRAVFRQRIARVQIEGQAGLLDRRPERPVLRQVVIDRPLAVADLREAVDQRATETERLDAALELLDREIRILHRQRGKRLKPRRAVLPPARRGNHWRGSQSRWRARRREWPEPPARSATGSSSRRRAGPSAPAACPGYPADAPSVPANRSPARSPPNPSACPGWRNVPLVRSCPACRPR